MARNSKGKAKAQGTGESGQPAKPYVPKINPTLANLPRIVTGNHTFRCLIDNPDAFKPDDYKNGAVVKECFGDSYQDLLNDLQSREAGDQYWQHPDLEDAGAGFVGTMNSPMKDGRKNGAMLQAMRPYLLLDRWITVLRKSPVDRTERPILRPHDLPGFKNKASKAAASKSESEGKGTQNVRKALHNSHSVTLQMINPAQPVQETETSSSEKSTLPMTNEHVWKRLIKYGVNSQRHSKMGTAQFRFAAMAVVVNFFIQRAYSDSAVKKKAFQLLHSQSTQEDIESQEWSLMLKEGFIWLNMAAATTLKDTLVFSFKKGPSAPFLLEVGIRHRQGSENRDFDALEKSLWGFLFDVALLKTEKTLTQHLWSIGEIAGAERPMEHNLSVVQFTEAPTWATSSKRQNDSPAPGETSRPAKKARTEGSDSDYMDVDSADEVEDAVTPDMADEPRVGSQGPKDGSLDALVVRQPHNRTQNSEERIGSQDPKDPTLDGLVVPQPQHQSQNSDERDPQPSQKDGVPWGGPGSRAGSPDVTPNIAPPDAVPPPVHPSSPASRHQTPTTRSPPPPDQTANGHGNATQGPPSALPAGSPPAFNHDNEHPTAHGPSYPASADHPPPPNDDEERNTAHGHSPPGQESVPPPPDNDDEVPPPLANEDHVAPPPNNYVEEVIEQQGSSPPSLEGPPMPNDDHPHSTSQGATSTPATPPLPIDDEDQNNGTQDPRSSSLNPNDQTGDTTNPRDHGKGTVATKRSREKKPTSTELESEKEGPRYPKRDRNPSKKAELSVKTGQGANASSTSRRRSRKKPALTSHGKAESAKAERAKAERAKAERAKAERAKAESAKTQTGKKAKEEEIDHYDRILFISNNVGYKFIDTEQEVIDVDALYEGFKKREHGSDAAMDVDAVKGANAANRADAALHKKKEKKAAKEAQEEEPKIRELEPMPPPANRMTVDMVVGGESLVIHTWYKGDFDQLTAFQRRFKEGKTSREDLVSQITSDAFKELSVERIGEIMAEKHVLVTGCSAVASVADMERRLLMKRVIDIQDLYFREKNDISCHCSGTLQKMKDIIESEDDDDRQRPMNALDLPCGQVPIDIARLGEISFRDTVWSFLKHVHRPRYQESIPMDDFRWALYSSRNAYSTPHVDANGLCTVIAPVDCRKLWILGRPLKEDLFDSRALKKFRMYDVNLNDYEWAPLLIGPGDILYMKPGTVHAVVTIDPGFTIGEHFYTMANLEESLASIFHLCAANALLTNANHNIAVMKTLVRLLHCWRHRLSVEVEEQGVPKLDFSNKSHLKCLVMVGTYLHVFPYVEDLERGLSPSDVEGLEQATEDYHFLYNSLVQHFDIYNTYYLNYDFEDDDEEDEKDWEELVYDDICRNGQMWIVAHLVEFFANARRLVDEKEMEKLDEHAGRLQDLIPKLLDRAGLSQQWFDRLHGWLKKNFANTRLDGWLNWDKLTIVPRGSLVAEPATEEEEPEYDEEEVD